MRIALAASLVILSLALPTAQAAAAETRIVVGRDPGLTVAERDNTVGITGVAPNARLMVLRALDDAGSGGDLDIAEAFDYAGDLGVPIVNASLGGEGASDVLDDAIMSHPNTLYVIAAGNNGADNDPETRTIYPCEVPAPNVICVGASTQADVPAGFSNFGATSVDLFAPGEAIYSTFPLDGYAAMSGTSMATPMVAAEAALVLDAAPELTTSQLKAVLLTGVDQKDAYAGRSVTGGRANAALALTEAGHPPPSDADADGIPDAGDACPIVAAPGTAAGCPVNVTPTPPPATTTPTATVAPTADRDGDGRSDSLDACPAEPAHSADGCPLPGVRALSVAVAKRTRRATATVRPDRPATVGIRIERRTCKVVAARNKCRWTTVASHARVTTGAPVRLVRRLARGSHRVTVTLTSSAGRARPVTKAFRVR